MRAITFDGPSGVGKTAVAAALAEEMSLPFFSIGTAYRAVALLMMRGLPALEAVRAIEIVMGRDGVELEVRHAGERLNESLYALAGIDGTTARISADSSIRAAVAARLRTVLGAFEQIVLDGRTAHVFGSDESRSFFCWADPAERARRAGLEMKRRGLQVSSDLLATQMQARDAQDFTRPSEPLRYRQGMVFWDSTGASSTQETVAAIRPWIRNSLRATVIVPVRDRPEHLRMTLEGLARQVGAEFEVIVVDDGSQEPVRGVPADLILRTPGVGASAARNCGIDHAQGDILIFLDGDMLVQAGFVARHVEIHALTYPLVVCGARRHLPAEGRGALRRDSREVIFDIQSYACSVLGKPWSLSYSCNLSVPAHLARNLGGFDESFRGWGLEDLEFAYRCHLGGAKFAYSRQCAAEHLWHDRSATLKRYEGWRQNLERFVTRHPSEEVGALWELAPAFDPAAREDFVACFARFDGGHVGLTHVTELDPCEDPLVQVQEATFHDRLTTSTTIVDPLDREDLGHRLNALGLAPMRFYTRSDWRRLEGARQGLATGLAT